MKDDKVQTGLRLTQSRYEDLKKIADRSGISINATLLLLVDIGLSAVNLGVEEVVRSLPHNLRHIDER